MRTLGSAEVGKYGAVVAFDNALPHLDGDDDIVATFSAIRTRLSPGGKAIISVRDYDRLLRERPTSMPAIFLWR
jgi:glycine/sarcosine N-methyltransferase